MDQREILERIERMNGRLIITDDGPPACGKTTQAAFTAEYLSAVHFSTSTVLRELNDPEVNTTMDQGKLVRDEIVVKALMRRIMSDPAKVFVIDGALRTGGETRDFFVRARKEGFNFFSILLQANLKILEERRRIRMESGEIRRDDDPEIWKERLLEFESNQLQVFHATMELSSPHIIDACGQAIEVWGQTREVLETEIKKLSLAPSKRSPLSWPTTTYAFQTVHGD